MEAIIERLSKLAPFTVGGIEWDGPKVVALFKDLGTPTLPDAMSLAEMERVNRLPALVAEWGWYVAEAKAAHDVAEREKRQKRSVMAEIGLVADPKKAEWKLNAAFRALPVYEKISKKIEEAERTWNAVQGVLDGLQAAVRIRGGR